MSVKYLIRGGQVILVDEHAIFDSAEELHAYQRACKLLKRLGPTSRIAVEPHEEAAFLKAIQVLGLRAKLWGEDGAKFAAVDG